MRSALYLAALVAVRHNPPLKAVYQHLLDQGKEKKVALIACARKLLTCLNAMLKSPPHGKTNSSPLAIRQPENPFCSFLDFQDNRCPLNPALSTLCYI